ncbi:MAG: permease-like cell division protein FtsX [Clostridia bacterium]|nr:permease-like cell division protein FtsX [Clostridia bacterium]
MGKVSLGYLTKEGFRNTWVNRLMSTASIAVLMSCLIMVGVAMMLLVNMNAIIGDIEDQNVIMVFIEDNASDAQIEKMGKEIKAMDNVESCVFVSKEEAFKTQIKDLKSVAELFDDESDNPLPDSYKVTLKDLKYFEKSIDSLKKLDNVSSLRENRNLAQKIMQISNAITYISITVIAILLLVSLFIISNTIKITMYNRKLEINIMKSVGATDWFIRWPFMVEGMVLGSISGVAAVGLVWLIYEFAVKKIMQVLSLLGTSPVEFTKYVLPMLGCFVAVGIVIGSIGSAFSIRKYLKEQDSITELEE